MIVLYNFFTSVAPAFLKIIAPFSPKIRLWLSSVQNWKEEINKSEIVSAECNVWFHCASLGEFEQGKPVMEALKQHYPKVSIVVTFFSPSGYSARKNTPLASFVGYLPIDTKENAMDFINIVKPQLAFFIKSEIWPNFINALRAKHIPAFLLSARFHEKQTLFKRRGRFFRNQLRKFDLIFVQNKSSRTLLKKHNLDSVFSGDTRYDQVSQLPAQKKEFPFINKFKNNESLLISGSVWMEDLEALSTFISGNETKIILAPHDVSDKMVLRIISFLKVPAIRYSLINEQTDLANSKVLIIDSIGMLASLYALADVAYVGGAFKQGLHNILEPAVYGIPVIFGPETTGFPEAAEILKEGGGFSIKDKNELNELLCLLFNDSTRRLESGKKNSDFIQTRKGATEKIMTSVKTTVSNLSCFSGN